MALALVAELASLTLLDTQLVVAGLEVDSLGAYFALHALGAAASAWLAWSLLPPQYRARRRGRPAHCCTALRSSFRCWACWPRCW